jgi:DNA repair exonuclease SbcCD ATPase subunit
MEGVQKRLEYYKKEKEKEIKDFFTYKGSIETDRFESCEEESKALLDERKELLDELKNLPQPKYLHIELDESVDVYKNEVKQLQDKKMNIVSNLAKHNTLIESLTESLHELDDKINTTRADMETSELTEYIADLKKKIADYEANFDVNDVPSMTKEQLNSDVDKLNMILFHLDQVMQLPYYTLEYFKKNYNHYGLDVNKMDNFAHKRMEIIMGQLHQMEKKKEIPEGILQIRYLPHACKSWKECPYYLELSNEHNKVKKDVKTLKASLLEEQECAEGLMQIASALFSIRKVLSMRDPDIREYRVSEETVIQCILSQDKSLLVDHELVQSLLEKIEYHDLYVKNKASLVDAERELELIRAKTNNVDIESLVKEQGKIFVKITNHKNMVNKLDKELKSIEQKIYATEELLQDYAIMKEYNLKSSECNYRLRDIDTKIDSCLDVIEKRNKFKEHERVYEEKIRNLDFQIKEAEREIYNLRMKESTFNQLTAEIQHVEEYYEYAELIKEAVSSRTGIPKIHIMFYCRALKTIANKIIEEIYDGELILRDFDIDDTKFNIPYYTKGANVSDIRYGSQAETSVATIAISFAILMQFMPKYNIILLDEIDGPMHETNKERLFASLEGQLKSIGCEQVFLITQSKAYNNYPVNLIITDPEYSKSVTNKQAVIFQR